MKPPGHPARHYGLCTLAWALLSLTAGDAFAIEAQTLRYAVSYGNLDAGQMVVRIDPQEDQDGGYVVEAAAEPNALARWFIDARFRSARFVQHNGEAVLHSGVERGRKGGEGLREFRVNRHAGRIEFGRGKHYAIAADDSFEAAAFPLALMLRAADGMAQIGGAAVREVSVRRVRDYRYAVPVAEAVTVAAGEFLGWKIIRHRIDRPADRVTVWLCCAAGEQLSEQIDRPIDYGRSGAHADNPVPLKITVAKSGKRTIRLELLGQ